jgi:hypothetical protein
MPKLTIQDYIKAFYFLKTPHYKILRNDKKTEITPFQFRHEATRSIVSVNHNNGNYSINLFADPNKSKLELNINLNSDSGAKTLTFNNLDDLGFREKTETISVGNLKAKFRNRIEEEKLFEFLGFLDNIIVHSAQYVESHVNNHGRQTTEANLNSILNSSYKVCNKSVNDEGTVIATVKSNDIDYRVICDNSNPTVITIFNRDRDGQVSKIKVADISFTTPQPAFLGLEMTKKGSWEHDRDLGRIDRVKFDKLIADINNCSTSVKTSFLR